MKTRFLKMVLSAAFAVIIAGTSCNVTTYAAGKVHRVTADNYSKYTTFEAPDKFMGWSKKGIVFRDGTGNVGLRYEGFGGKGATLYYIGHYSLGSVYDITSTGPATYEESAVDVMEALGMESNTDVEPGTIKAYNIKAYPEEKGETEYKRFQWWTVDFSDCRNNEEEIEFYDEIKPYDLAQMYALVLDEPIGENDFQTIYDLANNSRVILGRK